MIADTCASGITAREPGRTDAREQRPVFRQIGLFPGDKSQRTRA
jgi:hypothetical protein